MNGYYKIRYKQYLKARKFYGGAKWFTQEIHNHLCDLTTLPASYYAKKFLRGGKRPVGLSSWYLVAYR